VPVGGGAVVGRAAGKPCRRRLSTRDADAAKAGSNCDNDTCRPAPPPQPDRSVVSTFFHWRNADLHSTANRAYYLVIAIFYIYFNKL